MVDFDKMEIEILEDGTIKTTSDKVSMANHANAEQFLRYIAELSGGATTRERRGHGQQVEQHVERQQQK